MIIDGQKIANELEAGLKLKVKPGLRLAILLFKDDPGGEVYTRLKAEAATRVGIKTIISSDPEILTAWNNDSSIQGIMIQRPGYRGQEFEHFWEELISRIAPEKDVDGLRLDSKFTPATVRAVELVLAALPLRSGNVVVVGRGMIGRQLAKRFAVVALSSQDKNLAEKCLQADVLITACGKKGLIKAVKTGAVVIDCGWPKGDVDFEAVKNLAAAITPVPGGVGPITVVCLLENLIKAVYNQAL